MIGIAREHMKTQAAAPGAQRGLGGGRRRQPLFRLARRPGPRPRPIRKRQGTILYVTAEVLRQVAILAQPFMPSVGGEAARSSGRSGRANAASPRSAASKRIAPDATLPPPAPVFPRYVEPESKGADNAGRQPLPPGFSRFRRRARRRGGARARRRHRPHGHHLDPRAKATRRCWRSPRNFRRFSARSAPIRTTPTRNSDIDAKALIALRQASESRGDRRGRPRLSLRQQPARRAGSRASASTSPRRAKPGCRW